MNFNKYLIPLFILSIFISGCSPSAPKATLTPAATPARQMIVSRVAGEVRADPPSGNTYSFLGPNDPIHLGDTITVPGGSPISYVELQVNDDSMLVLSPGTKVIIDQVSPTTDSLQTQIELLQGGLLAVALKPLGDGFFEVKTSSSVSTINDGAMVIDLASGTTTTTCTQGSVKVTSTGGSSLILPVGNTAVVPASADPTQLADSSQVPTENILLWHVINDSYAQYSLAITPGPTLEVSPTATP